MNVSSSLFLFRPLRSCSTALPASTFAVKDSALKLDAAGPPSLPPTPSADFFFAFPPMANGPDPAGRQPYRRWPQKRSLASLESSCSDPQLFLFRTPETAKPCSSTIKICSCDPSCAHSPPGVLVGSSEGSSDNPPRWDRRCV